MTFARTVLLAFFVVGVLGNDGKCAHTACGKKCADLHDDVTNCGKCGNACPTTRNGKVSCKKGKCVVTCNKYFKIKQPRRLIFKNG